MPPELCTPIKHEGPCFGAGVLTIVWADEPPFTLTGRGPVYVVVIVDCDTASESLSRDLVNAALHGLIVRAPDGSLGRIAGVESHCITPLGVGQNLGLLLAPVEGP
jgi:hypothetical protein